MQSYEYPLNLDWTTDEMVAVVNWLSAVEQVYESSVDIQVLSQRYAAFKQVVTSIGEEKRIDKSFMEASGYSTYQVVKAMKQQQATAPSVKKLTLKR